MSDLRSPCGLYIPISPPVLRDWLILRATVTLGLAAGFIRPLRGTAIPQLKGYSADLR